MKSFNIIRYLKKWWPLIALMSFCAGVFFMRYATSNQAYTAQSIIKYNYSQAEDGKTPQRRRTGCFGDLLFLRRQAGH